MRWVNPFQPSVAFHIKTSHLICYANQITGFYMKWNNGLKLVNIWCTCLNSTLIEDKRHSTSYYITWKNLEKKLWSRLRTHLPYFRKTNWLPLTSVFLYLFLGEQPHDHPSITCSDSYLIDNRSKTIWHKSKKTRHRAKSFLWLKLCSQLYPNIKANTTFSNYLRRVLIM